MPDRAGGARAVLGAAGQDDPGGRHRRRAPRRGPVRDPDGRRGRQPSDGCDVHRRRAARTAPLGRAGQRDAHDRHAARPRGRHHRGRHPPAARARADALAPGPRRLPDLPRRARGAPGPTDPRGPTMTDPQSWVAPTYDGLADLLAAAPAGTWDASSLCAGWQVRHVVAHVTMPARLTPEQFGAEMAAARGDFGVLSDTVAARDSALPAAELVAQLRSPGLHAWQPPGGGAAGALSHAVIHSLDVTVALDRPPVAPDEAVVAVLDQMVAADGRWFGLDLTGIRLEAADVDRGWGNGAVVRADSDSLAALLAGRTLPDGRALPRG